MILNVTGTLLPKKTQILFLGIYCSSSSTTTTNHSPLQWNGSTISKHTNQNWEVDVGKVRGILS